MSAADRVWELVSGLPSPRREEWLMVALQGFIDDSGEQELPNDPVFVLAGFITSAERWASFSQEWQAALDAAPSIRFFKMNQAITCTGEFRGWTKAGAGKKVEILTAIIPRYAETRVQCVIDKKAFAKYVRTIRAPKRLPVLDKPYALAFQHIIMATATTFLAWEFNNTCDFIFDQQGKIGEDAVRVWDGLQLTIEANAAAGRLDYRPFIGERPIFRDDKKFLPLQAADLYAWHVRRDYADSEIIEMPPRPAMRALRNMSTIQRYIDEQELKRFREYIDRRAEPLIARNPHVPLFGYAGTQKQQARARVEERARRVSARKASRPSSREPK